MYGLTIQPINPNADGIFFNYWVIDNYTIATIEHEPTHVTVWFTEEPIQATKDAITAKYNSLTQLDVLISDVVLEEIRFKEEREEYGITIYNTTSAMSRINRLSLPDLPENEHEQYRNDHYEPLKHVVEYILKGDFKSSYEEVNNFVPTVFITAETLTIYRTIVSMYLISKSKYTDLFGNRVNGGTYLEHFNDTIDTQGFLVSA